ncbi:MAG: HD domain-containing protein [Lachnospiraceae bacterium]|nr:HD domain-containing protein [Lachnospiraceae bacterium]
MYVMKRSFKELISVMKENHKVVYEGIIRKAYDYADKKHEGQVRKTGEGYIMHPLRVAYLVASWGSESDMVIAALLHDVVEDCDTPLEEIQDLFGVQVAEMVDTLTAVNEDIEKAKGMTKEEIDNMSDARLIRKISKKALIIKVADRIDNLNTISTFPIDKQLKKAYDTRKILMPMVKKVGAYKLIDTLEELCLAIDHSERYHKISRRYSKIRNNNTFSTNLFMNTLKDIFNENCGCTPQNLAPYKKYIQDFVYNPRSIVSVYRQLVHNSDNYEDDFDKLMTKQHIALYDLTLIIKDDYTDNSSLVGTFDIFFKFYEEILLDRGICIAGIYKTTYEDSEYIILRDEMDNLYRLFIRTEQSYLRYKFGDILDDLVDFKYEDVNDINPSDAYNKKIKVFKKDNTSMYIDEGATVLDFAFAIHNQVGLHYKNAYIDDSPTPVSISTPLHEGDKVFIDTDKEKMTAKITWFRYVKTSKAINTLVKVLG